MRPRDLALLMLAAAGKPPRKRARDQKADAVGFDLRRQFLDRLVELDPDADQLEATLLGIISEMKSPQGPTRAIAANVRDEILAARDNPGVVELLIADAVQAGHIQEGRPS
jgi:hypothetical protein